MVTANMLQPMAQEWTTSDFTWFQVVWHCDISNFWTGKWWKMRGSTWWGKYALAILLFPGNIQQYTSHWNIFTFPRFTTHVLNLWSISGQNSQNRICSTFHPCTFLTYVPFSTYFAPSTPFPANFPCCAPCRPSEGHCSRANTAARRTRSRWRPAARRGPSWFTAGVRGWAHQGVKAMLKSCRWV